VLHARAEIARSLQRLCRRQGHVIFALAALAAFVAVATSCGGKQVDRKLSVARTETLLRARDPGATAIRCTATSQRGADYLCVVSRTAHAKRWLLVDVDAAEITGVSSINP
jgi:hypothetical protein